MKIVRDYSIDSNIILRYLTQDEDELTQKADEIIEGMEDGVIAVHCDPVIIAEVVWVLKSFYKMKNDRIEFLLEPILKSTGFVLP